MSQENILDEMNSAQKDKIRSLVFLDIEATGLPSKDFA